MGGFGSGRFGGKGLVGRYKSLDVNHLNKGGHLRQGSQVTLRWESEDGESDSLGLRADDDRVVLSYRVRLNSEGWSNVEEAVAIAWLPCQFGGARPYFLCPGEQWQACRRRVTKLCLAGRLFLCRHCYNLAYASQCESSYDRLLRREEKHGAALGDNSRLISSVPPKPKGMHWRTYWKHVAELRRCQARRGRIFRDLFPPDWNRHAELSIGRGARSVRLAGLLAGRLVTQPSATESTIIVNARLLHLFFNIAIAIQ
jgi:hypothetical protein